VILCLSRDAKLTLGDFSCHIEMSRDINRDKPRSYDSNRSVMVFSCLSRGIQFILFCCLPYWLFLSLLTA
jgi:hypothetical protein